MSKKFAKLFEMPDGGQVLIQAIYDEEGDKDILSASTMLDSCHLEMKLSFKSVEDRDKAFESRNQAKAEDLYRQFKEQV